MHWDSAGQQMRVVGRKIIAFVTHPEKAFPASFLPGKSPELARFHLVRSHKAASPVHAVVFVAFLLPTTSDSCFSSERVVQSAAVRRREAKPNQLSFFPHKPAAAERAPQLRSNLRHGDYVVVSAAAKTSLLANERIKPYRGTRRISSAQT